MTQLKITVALGGLVAGALLAAPAHAVAAPAPELAADTAVTVPLTATDGSEATGEAHIAPDPEGGTAVSIHIHGAPAGSSLQAVVLDGTCAEPGEVRVALAAVTTDGEGQGEASATVTAEVGEVLQDPAAVYLVEARGEDHVAVLCGDATSPAEADEA